MLRTHLTPGPVRVRWPARRQKEQLEGRARLRCRPTSPPRLPGRVCRSAAQATAALERLLLTPSWPAHSDRTGSEVRPEHVAEGPPASEDVPRLWAGTPAVHRDFGCWPVRATPWASVSLDHVRVGDGRRRLSSQT